MKISYKLIKYLITGLLATIIFHSNLHAQLNVDSVIINHLNVSGLKDFHSVLQNYTLTGDILQNNMNFPIVIRGLMPDKFRMDMTFNKKDFIKISNGKLKWEYNPFTDSISAGKAPGNEALDFVERWCGALFRFGSANSTLKFMGLTTIDDIETYKLEFMYNGQSRIYYLDRYSYLIVRIDDDYVENKITYYSEYKKVGRYLLPFNITGYENATPVMSMKFKDVKINEGQDESFFAKPK